jgi:hypothetical protein
MKKKKSNILYNLLVNIPVCLSLCIASTLLNGLPVNWPNFFLNFAVSFVIAMAIGLFVPLTAIGRWFTALFKIDTTTYQGNLPYRLLATLISSCIFYFAISPTLTVMNFLLSGATDWATTFVHWLLNIPFLFLVGYLSTLVSDIPAYQSVHRLDPDF